MKSDSEEKQCRELPKVGLKISTGLEVVAIPIDECRFESCPGSQKIVVVLQNFEKNQHRCRGKL